MGHPWPVGLAQGRFAIKRNAAHKPHVFQELDGLTLHTAPQSAAKKAPPTESFQGMPLNQFLARVRTLSKDQKQETRDAH